MKTKLLVLFAAFVACLCGLIGVLTYIVNSSGDRYQRIVLAQQAYDSTTIPFQRGDIVDTNGTVLATSVAVYNVVVDPYVMTYNYSDSDEKDYVGDSIDAIDACFSDYYIEVSVEGQEEKAPIDKQYITDYVENHSSSRYFVIAEELTAAQIQAFEELQEENDAIVGVWFEKEYQRTYPFSSLASAVLGFVSDGNVGTSGLESYYDDVLNGTDGREYGYLNSDSDYEKTVIDAEDGNTLVLSIDASLQAIVEEKILEFNEALADNYREGEGSENTAVVIMDPNTGEILAMADYPSYDCNNPRDLSVLYTEEEQAELTDDEVLDILNQLWQNFCVSSTYEPGSVQKACTIAGGLDTGTLNTNMTFECDGYEQIGTYTIHCVNRSGHGTETLETALMDSCNDALMQMSYLIGVDNFTAYQSLFNFGKKTGVDLPGEASASTLIYTADNMTTVDLATNSFGQNYNCTMIQMISAYASLINGGTYYQPHVVRKIVDSDGNTVETIDATVLKQTISESTSDIIRSYLGSVVSDGTGATAKVDGYSMGGKTGTAEKSVDGTKSDEDYLVSFIGYTPLDDPQILIYVVVDTPNVEDQSHSSYAQNLAREILEEALPYLNIYPDEELTGVNTDLDIIGNSISSDIVSGSDDVSGNEDSGDAGDTTGNEDSGDAGDTTGDEDSGDGGDAAE